jgi:tetratricopeptide (TPR) repeat protein
MNPTEPPIDPNKRSRFSEWTSVMVLSLVLFVGTAAALVLIQRQAVDFLTRVESEAAGPILASQLLQEQGWKHARRVLASLDRDPATGEKQLTPEILSELKASEDCFDRARIIDPRKELDPSWAAVYGVLGTFAELAPRPALMQGMHAAAELTAGRKDHARAIATSATQTQHPDGIPVQAYMVLMEMALQDLNSTEVRRQATLLTKVSPDQQSLADVYSAEASLVDKDADGAARLFEDALRRGTRKPSETRYRLAETYIRMVRQKDATRVLEEGLDPQTRRDPVYLHRLGIFLLADQRPEEALRILESARLLAPNNGDILWTQSRAAERSGQIRLGAKLLQQALSIDPKLQSKTADKWP